jgi:DNA-binding PadR family transcriptional regulator
MMLEERHLPILKINECSGRFRKWDSVSIRFALMARMARGSDGFGREVILGLLTEEPSNCYQLDRRLAERFGSAAYTHGTARQAIKRLVDEGLVCVGSANRRVAAGGGVRARTTTYEATPTGVKHFHEWMWASVSTPPVREELHAKIALCRPIDLPRMIEVVRGGSLRGKAAGPQLARTVSAPRSRPRGLSSAHGSRR